jgi:hypothetical protein
LKIKPEILVAVKVVGKTEQENTWIWQDESAGAGDYPHQQG